MRKNRLLLYAGVVVLIILSSTNVGVCINSNLLVKEIENGNRIQAKVGPIRYLIGLILFRFGQFLELIHMYNLAYLFLLLGSYLMDGVPAIN